MTEKWIRDENIKAKIIKVLAENIGENLSDLVLGKEFLGHQEHEP